MRFHLRLRKRVRRRMLGKFSKFALRKGVSFLLTIRSASLKDELCFRETTCVTKIRIQHFSLSWVLVLLQWRQAKLWTLMVTLLEMSVNRPMANRLTLRPLLKEPKRG